MSRATQSATSSTPPPRPSSLRIAAGSLHLRGRDMPRRLNRLRIISAAVALGFSAWTLLQLVVAGQALHSAAQDTQQLIRVQNVKVHLLRADALATNAFLIGGLESPEQREAYDTSLDEATRAIVAAAEAQTLDRAVLGELNQVIVEYAEGMAQARATNRQQLPVGAGYLRAASSQLRDRGVVLVDALVAANTERAQRSIGAHKPPLMALPAVIALVVFGLLNQWIARRFKRRINTGLAGGAAIILAVGVAATLLSEFQASANAELRDTDYATAVLGAEIRSDANAAKTDESLRLISRGSGQAYEIAWQDHADQVAAALAHTALGRAPEHRWQGYLDGHRRVVELDDRGRWDDAVALATSRAEDAPTMHFSGFDAGMEELVKAGAGRASETLLAGRPWFDVMAVVTVLGGLAAAALAWRGVSARLMEYA